MKNLVEFDGTEEDENYRDWSADEVDDYDAEFQESESV